tara:strand:+ start:195 stop:581 length:387 start_codon:yes stop_codon:yes gene_type:complete
MKIILLLLCFVWGEEVVEEPKIKELEEKSFKIATRSGITIIEYWAAWNELNKVTMLDSIEIADAKIYRVNIDTNPQVTAKQKIVVVPTIIVYDDGIEYKRLQADLTFIIKVTKKDLQIIVDEILMSKF